MSLEMLTSHLIVSPVDSTCLLSFKNPSSRSACSKSALTCCRDGFQSARHAQGVESRSTSASPLTLHVRPIAALNSAGFRRLRELESQEEEDNDLCPVECVKEFKTRVELADILAVAKLNDTLVVVDFYKTACGSCKYIEQGFIKLCKGAGDDEAAVIFFKHNVMDEYEEQSELAKELRIKVVPLFHFYKDGQLVESFATREKTKLLETIEKYLSSIPASVAYNFKVETL